MQNASDADADAFFPTHSVISIFASKTRRNASRSNIFLVVKMGLKWAKRWQNCKNIYKNSILSLFGDREISRPLSQLPKSFFSWKNQHIFDAFSQNLGIFDAFFRRKSSDLDALAVLDAIIVWFLLASYLCWHWMALALGQHWVTLGSTGYE